MTDGVNIMDIVELRKQWDEKRKKTRFEQKKLFNEESQKEHRYVEETYYDVLKNLTILSATAFATSIALASGFSVNYAFMIGEILLLVATFLGILFLIAQLKSREQSLYSRAVWELKGDLMLYTDIMEDFELEATKGLLKSYQGLLDRKGIWWPVLKIIKIDYVPDAFFITFLLGLALILASLFIK